MKFEAPRGTQDVLPAQQPLWERVLRETEEVCAVYGYRRITTPLVEDTELFTRTSGVGSDVVQKEMYTFTDRGDRSLTLRPEGTASVARAYVEHGLFREAQPVKTYLIGPMYRYSAPQRGKFREFWQLNVEAMGSDDPALDAEVIQLYAELLRRLGIEGWWLELNSIGDRNCRPAYLERLNEWLEEHARELDEDTLAKRKTSPLRVFDNLPQKPEAVQLALAAGPRSGSRAASSASSCRLPSRGPRLHNQRSTSSSRSRTTGYGRRCSRRWRSSAGLDARLRRTMRVGRSRASSRRPAVFAPRRP